MISIILMLRDRSFLKNWIDKLNLKLINLTCKLALNLASYGGNRCNFYRSRIEISNCRQGSGKQMASRIVRASRLSHKLVLFSLLYSKLSAFERKKILDRVDCGRIALVTPRYNGISRELGAGIVFVLKRTRHSIPCVHRTLANVIQSGSGIQLRDLWLMALLRIHVGTRGMYLYTDAVWYTGCPIASDTISYGTPCIKEQKGFHLYGTSLLSNMARFICQSCNFTEINHFVKASQISVREQIQSILDKHCGQIN